MKRLQEIIQTAAEVAGDVTTPELRRAYLKMSDGLYGLQDEANALKDEKLRAMVKQMQNLSSKMYAYLNKEHKGWD